MRLIQCSWVTDEELKGINTVLSTKICQMARFNHVQAPGVAT